MSSNYHPQQQQQQIRLPPESVNEGTVMIVLPLALALASLTEQNIYPCPNFTQQRLCATWTYPNPNLKNRTTEPLWHNETTLPLSIVTRRVRSQSLSATTIRLTHHWSMLFIRLTNHCFMIFIWLTHLWSMLFIWLTHIWSPIPLSPSLSPSPSLPLPLSTVTRRVAAISALETDNSDHTHTNNVTIATATATTTATAIRATTTTANATATTTATATATAIGRVDGSEDWRTEEEDEDVTLKW